MIFITQCDSPALWQTYLPKSIEPPHRVASQLNILIPVGIAIIMVAAVK